MRKIFVLCFIAGVSGCGSTDGRFVHAAYNACKDKGGVSEMIHDASLRHVYCMDGTYFENVGSK